MLIIYEKRKDAIQTAVLLTAYIHGVLGASVRDVGCQAILGRQLFIGAVPVAAKPALQNRPRLVTPECEYNLRLSVCCILAFCVEILILLFNMQVDVIFILGM